MNEATLPPDPPDRRAAGDDPSPAEPDQLGRVEEVVRMLAKTLRAHQLYEGRSPSYDRIVAGLREGFQQLWALLPALVLDIEENRLFWEGHEVYRSEQRVESLAFLFYRDGVRQIVSMPGFEAAELPRLIQLLAQVHRTRQDEDDLLTLLWEADFEFFRYRHVEISMDGLDLPMASGAAGGVVDPQRVRAEAAAGAERGWSAGPAAQPTSIEHPFSFQDSSQVLEATELERLRADLGREMARSLWIDVVHGLLDRLEDGEAERQGRIVRVFTELLPGVIGSGDIAVAALLLRELTAFLARPGTDAAAGKDETAALFEQLADTRTIQELIRSVEDAPEAFPAEAFAELLGHFPAAALAPVISGTEQAVSPAVRRSLESAVERLAARFPDEVMALVASPDPVLAAGAARLAGALGLVAATGTLVELLRRSEMEIRLAAVGALQDLRAASAASALVGVLEDPAREVRIAAARALGLLRYPPAREPLERLLDSRRMREADVTERLAVFEAYGSLAGQLGVPVLDRLLNGRGWLGRRASAEIRASAALALGRISHPDALAALATSRTDPDPVVRAAVGRALRSAESPA